jgi:sucrose phosphorylase
MLEEQINRLLESIYGQQIVKTVFPRVVLLLEKWRGKISRLKQAGLSEKDAILITYGDQVRLPDQLPLQTLTGFCENYLRGLVNGIHILPFYPWSSDDGFSVMDYRKVDPALGLWEDVERLGQTFHLMVDGVINHASAKGEWFQSFLRNEPPYRDYFYTVEGEPDLSQVVRPRTLPLLTEFQTAAGLRKVWTTFSADQVDLDFRNPDVLLEIFDILLMYIQRGARFIRLDAIAYLWKEPGTTCIHLPQTHAVIQLLRAVLDDIAPHVSLITETNVSHSDNISYFGDGSNEARMVYNFALPPLVLHTLQTGDATRLTQWASGLELPTGDVTFLNFLASHDGIGLNPARGILGEKEIETLVDKCNRHGGLVSLKNNVDGTQSPYEMNINYFDALSDPNGKEPIDLQVDRFMAAQAILLSLRGVPGIYFHSLFGSRGWKEGVNLTGHNRTINRQKCDLLSLHEEITNPASLRSMVFTRYRGLLTRRAASPAFDPFGRQKILEMGKGVFAVLRTSPDGNARMLCLQNISPIQQRAGNHLLKPYETIWTDKV